MGFRKTDKKKEACSTVGCCTQRFKGVENFLRRIAFNLGNTPSQTEVKIISCIPIDVSDLQQKVLSLEKQLEQFRCPPSCVNMRPESSVHRVLTKNRFMTENGIEMNDTTSSYDLKRSYLLANETRQRYEPRLQYEPRCDQDQPCQQTNIAPTSILSKCFRKCTERSSSNRARKAKHSNERTGSPEVVCFCDDYCSNYDNHVAKNKSNVSFVYPAVHETASNEINYPNQTPVSQLCLCNNPGVMTGDSMSPAMPESKLERCKKSFFKRRKTVLNHKKNKTEYVYYARANNVPFIKSAAGSGAYSSKEDAISRAYFADMIQRQYQPKPLGDDLSAISKFTTPICRDIPQTSDESPLIDSDICSCCYEPFKNIDNQTKSMANNVQAYMVNELKTRNTYYDSSLYDMIPVKDKSTKDKRNIKEITKNRGLEAKHKLRIEMRCWPGDVHAKHRHQVLHHQSDPSLNSEITPSLMNNFDYISPRTTRNYKKKIPVKGKSKEGIERKQKRKRQIKKRHPQSDMDASQTCSMDLGYVYKKRIFKPRVHRELVMLPKATHSKKVCKKPLVKQTTKVACVGPIQPPCKNAECLTTVITNGECQTITSSPQVTKPDAKTDVTINQIKTILQSVLAEVKVTAQSKKIPEDQPKRDAYVQKGTSQNMMEGSSFLNSITYSPYSMNPYLPSCSRNMAAYYYQQNAFKCLQNYPLLIQPPGRLCNCYNSTQLRSMIPKPATTIATNTDQEKYSQKPVGNETEKLIHEIYKSMALTMDIPNKGTSISEYNDIRSSKASSQKSEAKTEKTTVRSVVQNVSELFVRKNLTTDTSVSATLPESNSYEVSARSQRGTSTDGRLRKERLDQFIRPSTSSKTDDTTIEKRSLRKEELATTEADTSTESDSDTVTVISPSQSSKKKKVGLLSMLKSVFKPKESPEKKQVKAENNGENSSDSDDYQTIYSQKVARTVRQRPPAINIVIPKRRTHSKISYQRRRPGERSPEKSRRSPYMEQEYRKYWDERIMFQNKQRQETSDPYTKKSESIKKSGRTVTPSYYRHYETRTALVAPKRPQLVKGAPVNNRAIANFARSHDNGQALSNSKPIAAKGLSWLKNHKMGLKCGEQWKKFILES